VRGGVGGGVKKGVIRRLAVADWVSLILSFDPGTCLFLAQAYAAANSAQIRQLRCQLHFKHMSVHLCDQDLSISRSRAWKK
jgi:hypothetical protein